MTGFYVNGIFGRDDWKTSVFASLTSYFSLEIVVSKNSLAQIQCCLRVWYKCLQYLWAGSSLLGYSVGCKEQITLTHFIPVLRQCKHQSFDFHYTSRDWFLYAIQHLVEVRFWPSIYASRIFVVVVIEIMQQTVTCSNYLIMHAKSKDFYLKHYASTLFFWPQTGNSLQRNFSLNFSTNHLHPLRPGVELQNKPVTWF